MALTSETKTDLYRFFSIAFNAAPGVTYMNQLAEASNAGMSVEQIVEVFTGKDQFKAVYPLFLTNAEFATRLVSNVVGASATDAAKAEAVADITAALGAGWSKGKVIYTIFNNLASKAPTDATWGATSQQMANKVAVAKYYTETLLRDSTDLATLQAVIGNVTSTSDTSAAALEAALNPPANQVYRLTTDLDNVVGGAGNDTINAVAGAFSALDAVDGGAGRDTANIVFGGDLAAAAPGATVKNIEVANLTSGAAITAANVSGWTGLQTVNIVGSAAIGGVVAAATTDVNISGATAGVTVNGGKNVAVSNGTAGAVSVGATTAAAGNVTASNTVTQGTVAVRGAGVLTASAKDGGITFTGGSSIVASAPDAVSPASRAANADANDDAVFFKGLADTDADAAGVAKLAAAAKVTNLGALATAIAAATNSSANQGTALSIQAATLDAVNNGAITAADKVAIDAAFIAALATSQAAARTAAQALVTPLQAAATVASASAAAADAANDAVVTAAAAAAAALVAADTAKGALVDGVNVTATTNTTLTSASVTGNYGATNIITDGSTLGNVLTTVSLENAGNTTITGNAVANVSVKSQNGISVTVNNTTVGHTMNFTLDGARGYSAYGIGTAANNLTDNVAATVNVISNGAATNSIVLGATTAKAVNVTGAVGVNFGTAIVGAAADATIDASGNSGTNTIRVGAAQKYVGGSGRDVVTVNNGVAQAATVDGGAGTTDQLTLGSNADFAGTAATKFLNFEALRLNTGVSADVSKFTGSSIASLTLSGNVTASGLNATQAGAISILGGAQTLTIGVKGASSVGQLDTVSITNNTANANIGAPTLVGVETLNITGSRSMTITGLTNATALTNVNFAGTGSVNLTVDALPLNVNTVISAAGVTGSTGSVVINALAATANGLQIIGSATKPNTITGNALASILTGGARSDTITGGPAADVINAGEGNNTIVGGGGGDTVTAGDGNNTVTLSGGTAATVTLGNGYNVVTGTAGADTIKVGTGANLITANAGGDTITFGNHATGVLVGVVMSDGDSQSAANTAAMITAAAAGFTGIDVITGMKAGDTLNLSAVDAGFSSVVATGINGAAGNAVALVRGLFDATTGVFTASASGTDSLLVYDIDGAGAGTVVEAVVLVGYAGGATAAGGVIALGG